MNTQGNSRILCYRKFSYYCWYIKSIRSFHILTVIQVVIGNPCVKRAAGATIKIAPYKEHPKCL